MVLKHQILTALHQWLQQQGIDCSLNLTLRPGTYSVGAAPNISFRGLEAGARLRGDQLELVAQRYDQASNPRFQLVRQLELQDPHLFDQILAALQQLSQERARGDVTESDR